MPCLFEVFPVNFVIAGISWLIAFPVILEGPYWKVWNEVFGVTVVSCDTLRSAVGAIYVLVHEIFWGDYNMKVYHILVLFVSSTMSLYVWTFVLVITQPMRDLGTCPSGFLVRVYISRQCGSVMAEVYCQQYDLQYLKVLTLWYEVFQEPKFSTSGQISRHCVCHGHQHWCVLLLLPSHVATYIRQPCLLGLFCDCVYD